MTTGTDTTKHAEKKLEEQRAIADEIIRNCENSLRDLAKRGDKRAQAEVLKRGLG